MVETTQLHEVDTVGKDEKHKRRLNGRVLDGSPEVKTRGRASRTLSKIRRNMASGVVGRCDNHHSRVVCASFWMWGNDKMEK
jgi:hypothetical protein